MSDDGNVISLPVGDKRREHNQRESEIAELPVARARWSMSDCEHLHSIVNARARTVTCDSCGVTLDPITVLDRIAHEFAEPLRRAQEADKRRRDLQESIGRLEREERNAKARVRTARARALEFDAAAVLAAARAAYRSYGRSFDEIPEDQQQRVIASWSASIEAYIGMLNAGGNTSMPLAIGSEGTEVRDEL